jgi:hypothetical protein
MFTLSSSTVHCESFVVYVSETSKYWYVLFSGEMMLTSAKEDGIRSSASAERMNAAVLPHFPI